MSNENKKDWERPWSTEEIVEHADNWNLACDAALLNTLKDFGNKILEKAEKVHEKIDNLCDNLDKTSLRVDLARNEFNSLRNSQFMECRVYEEDETLLIENKEDKNENLYKEETVEDLREAVSLGLGILNKYHEKVEVEVSDSEEDDENIPSYVYRRKDLYINRPLPHVIGSDKWYKKWHVGLQESSDSENEKSASDKFSESEDDECYQVKEHSDVSSELSLSGLNNNLQGQPAAVSTANTTLQNESILTMPKGTTFAEQLAEKLGNVIKENGLIIETDEVNRRPIQKKNDDYGALFSNEPPPLEDETNEDSQGIFSGGKGLFDDVDDDDLWNPVKSPSLQIEKEKTPTIQKGIFNDDSSDDDNFRSPQKLNSKPYLNQNKSTVPIFNEEPPILEVKEKKPPAGGVSLFGNVDIFKDQKVGDLIKEKRRNSSDDEENPSKQSDLDDKKKLNEEEDFFSNVNRNVKDKPKITSLFDDSLDDEEFDFFKPKNEEKLVEKPGKQSKNEENQSKNERKQAENLTKNEEKQPETEIKKDEIKKKVELSLFDDDFEDVDDLFSEILKNPRRDSKLENSKTSENIQENLKPDDDLFAEISKTLSKNLKSENLQTSPSPEKIQENSKTVDNFFSKIPKEDSSMNLISENPQTSLSSEKIRENSENDDDFFSKISKNDSSKNLKYENPSPSENNQENSESEKLEKSHNLNIPNVNFFDSIPPPDNDLWENNSDNNVDDFEPYNDNFQSQPSSLFDNEPPSLLFNNTSGIVSDQVSNRIDSISNSFDPSLTSSRRLSCDNQFSEYQISDSIFSVKQHENRSVVHLESDENVFDNTDITPSGNPDQLYIDSTLNEASLDERDECKNPIKTLIIDKINDDKNRNDRKFEDPCKSDDEMSTNKVSELAQKFRNESDAGLIDKRNDSSKAVPKKLRHSLNINVGALLPGSAPPRREKHHSNEEENEIPTPTISNLKPPPPPILRALSEGDQNKLKKSVSFENETNIEVLKSITKDRVRIPVKRKPSTRRGRQELRNSIEQREEKIESVTAEEKIESEVEDKQNFEIEKVDEDDVKKPEIDELFDEKVEDKIERESGNLFDSFDEPPAENSQKTTIEELFQSKKEKSSGTLFDLSDDSGDDDFLSNTKEQIVPKIMEKSEQKIDLFNSSDDDDKNEIPSGNAESSQNFESSISSSSELPTTKNSGKNEKNINLFDSSDDDDDDFLKSLSKNEIKQNSKVKSLFEDVEDDSDIFGTSLTTKTSNIKVPETSVIKKSKPSNLCKLENVEGEDDPLSAMLK